MKRNDNKNAKIKDTCPILLYAKFVAVTLIVPCKLYTFVRTDLITDYCPARYCPFTSDTVPSLGRLWVPLRVPFFGSLILLRRRPGRLACNFLSFLFFHFRVSCLPAARGAEPWHSHFWTGWPPNSPNMYEVQTTAYGIVSMLSEA